MKKNQNKICEHCNQKFSISDGELSLYEKVGIELPTLEHCEDLFYSYRNLWVKNSIDVAVCFNSEKCYDSSECHHSYKIFYSWHSRDCIDSYFLYDCRNCLNCFMCRQNFNFKIYNSDGDYLLDCKNCHNCNTISESEDCYNCVRNGWLKSSFAIFNECRTF